MPVIWSATPNIDFQRCLLNFTDSLEIFGFTDQDIEDAKKIEISLKTKAPILLHNEIPHIKQPNSWNLFIKKYPNGFYEVSTPVINETLDRIIISINYYCNDRCGWGKTEIYKKTTNGWKLVRVICTVVS